MIKAKTSNLGELVISSKIVADRMKYILKDGADDVVLGQGKLVRLIKSLPPTIPKDPTSAIELAVVIGAIDRTINLISCFATSVNLFIDDTEASLTYIKETATEIERYRRKAVCASRSPEIYKKILMIVVKVNPHTVEKMVNKRLDGFVFLAIYLQDKLDNGGGQIFIDILECAKSSALAPPKPDLLMKHNRLQRASLIPVRQQLTISQLVAIYFGDTSGGGVVINSIDIFSNIAQSRDINVLVIISTTPNPIAYDTLNMVNEEAAAPLIEDVHVGVNPKVMRRLNSIRRLNGTKLKYEVLRHEHKKGGRWVVVRTIDGETWDALSNNMMSKTKISINPSSLFVERRIVDVITRGPSPRIHNYNKKKNGTFAKHLIPTIDDSESIKRDNSAVIERLIHIIYNNIVAYIDKSLSPLPTTPIGIEEAIRDPQFVAIMKEKIVESYAESGINVSVPSVELISTFVAAVDGTIMTRFAREIKRQMMDNGPNVRVFKELDGAALLTKLHESFTEIIKNSIYASIKSKENLYETLLVKDNILKALGR
jgi:hypothetical protein